MTAVQAALIFSDHGMTAGGRRFPGPSSRPEDAGTRIGTSPRIVRFPFRLVRVALDPETNPWITEVLSRVENPPPASWRAIARCVIAYCVGEDNPPGLPLPVGEIRAAFSRGRPAGHVPWPPAGIGSRLWRIDRAFGDVLEAARGASIRTQSGNPASRQAGSQPKGFLIKGRFW